MSDVASKKTNKLYVIGILIFCVGLMFSNYGPGMAIPAKLGAMDGMSYYALISAMGTLGMILVLPMVGKLYAIFGIRNVLIFGILLQLAARIGCMLSASVAPLLILYCVQAIGGGVLMPAAYTLMAGAVSSEDRPKYYGFIATFNAIGSLLGPILCGWLVDRGVGDLAFVAYIPIVIVAFICIFRSVPNQRQAQAAVGFDYLGVVLLVVSITCIVLWMNLGGKDFPWASLPSIAMIVVGIFALVALIRRSLTIENPSVPLRLFKKKRLTSSFLVAFLLSGYSTCSAAYLIVYIQTILLSGNATISGTATMPQTIVTAILGVVIGGYLGKGFAKRFRPIGILAGVSALAASLLLFLLKPESSMFQVWIATALGGASLAISQSAFTAFFQTELVPEEIPAAQSLYSFGGTSGSVIFGAFAGIILNISGSYNHVFLLSVIWAVLALLIAFTGFRFSKEEIAAASPQ